VTASFKTALRAIFARKARSSAVQANSSAPSQRLPGVDVVQLNTDRDAISEEAASWLLKCIFRDQELLEYAKVELGSRLSTCQTCDEINRLVFAHFLAKVSAASDFVVLDPLDAQAFKAILEHRIDTRRNQQAYLSQIVDRPESGFWPDPSNPRNHRSLFTEFPFRRRHKIISERTPIISAGSCFAMEIAHELQRGGFNYVITERNVGGLVTDEEGAAGPSDASAAWGIIFNTPSFRQLVERAFGLRSLPRILWSSHSWDGDKGFFMDPFREEIKFRTVDEYRANCDTHVVAAREALSRAEVFILTLGLNEIWSFKMDGSVFSRSPWQIAPSFVEHRILTVEENVADLQLMLSILRRFNPGIKLIVSLSPVPLHATFRHNDWHVVEANMHSKAILRVAAQEFVERNNGVFYFPSFELVSCALKDPWGEDQRHVSRTAVAKVMEMFRDMFVV
jgi:hypothetical protein